MSPEKIRDRNCSWLIEWWVSAGSRLRLDISSSDFPKYHARIEPVLGQSKLGPI